MISIRKHYPFYLSDSSGGFSTNSSKTDVTNLTVTIDATGRPLLIGCIPDGTANLSYFGYEAITNYQPLGSIWIIRDSTDIWRSTPGPQNQLDASSEYSYIPPSVVNTFDQPAAGHYVYKIALTGTANVTARCYYTKLMIFEL